MKKREDNPTITLNVKYNDMYDLWNHLVDVIMHLDSIQEDLTELTSAVYDSCRAHENDPAVSETDESDEATTDVDGESLAIEILKAVFDCLSDICEKGDAE